MGFNSGFKGLICVLDKKQYTRCTYSCCSRQKINTFFFFLQIVVLMAIFAICAAHPQSLFDYFNPFYYFSLFTNPSRAPKPTDSSTTAAASTTAATTKAK